ncbi:hypothetical protein LTR86_001845 [Recurvomyces mirabilis]|nr:hypothetical protein LTR86_001845 [Recurvomyces mirabilis]
MTALLAQTSLPQKGRIPSQNCVTWTRDAITDLQRAGIVDDTLDVHDIMRGAFQKADLVMSDGPPRDPKDRFIDLDVLRREIATMKNRTAEDEVRAVTSPVSASRSAPAERSQPQAPTSAWAAEAASAKAAFVRLKQQGYPDDQAFELLVREYMKRDASVSRETATAGVRDRLRYQG